MKRQLLIFLILTNSVFSAHAGIWLAFEPEVVALRGVLILEKHAGPPNYGEGPADREETILVLRLTSPINVRGSPMNDLNQLDIRGATTVQLQVNWQQTEMEEFVNRQVQVKGKLYTAHTAHHFHKLLMQVSDMQRTDGERQRQLNDS